MLTPRATRPLRPAGLICGALMFVALVGLSGCATSQTSSNESGSGSETTTAPEPGETVAPAPVFIVDGSADENLPYFTYQLDTYAGGAGPIEGQPIADIIVGAGFDRGLMQLSFDRTKTNLVADFIFISVRTGESCLLGQVSTSDRSVSTIVEPAIGPDGSICLIGETRPIDW